MPNDESHGRAEWASWFDPFSLVREEPSDGAKYDLEERRARFGEAVIDFAATIPQNPITTRLITQLVGAGTSIGANYCEADDAVSRKEFFLRIGTCRKKARETKHFLWMIVRAAPDSKQRRVQFGAKRVNSISSLQRSAEADDLIRHLVIRSSLTITH